MRGPLPLLMSLVFVACVGEVLPPGAKQSAVDPSAAADADGGSPENDDGPVGNVVSEPDVGQGSQGSADPDQDPEGAGDGAQDTRCGEHSGSLVDGLQIDQIALYQTVKIPLVNAGQWVVERNAPVVQGKEALLRVFVAPQSGFVPHEVQAEILLQNGSTVTRFDTSLTPRVASTDQDLASTFNVRLPAEVLAAETSFSVALVEASCDPERAADHREARFPETGTAALEAAPIGALRVVLVPVLLNARLPDTGAAQLEAVRASLLAHYPVPAVEVTVGAPLTWGYAVNASGAGWFELLNEIRRRRQRDRVAADVYYFGLVTPAASFGGYCGRACVAGMAPQTTAVSSLDQVGLGLGFADRHTADTAIHEIGHAHGRGHAPCAPGRIDGVDRGYRYEGGAIGSWGWDARSGSLMPPTMKDMMGYCEPTWISDYTYAALAERSLAVNVLPSDKSRSSAPALRVLWQSLMLYADGTARWAGLSTTETPGGEREPLRVFDAQGQLIRELEAVRVPLAHAGDSFLYIPEPEPDWAVLELGSGLRLPLDAVLPPLN